MAGLGRASATVAVGTMASRITGLIRNIVLTVAIGTVGARAADSFAVANQLPNSVFALISSGLLAGVIVPQIVKAVKTHDDRGSAFVSKLLTLGVLALLVVTAVAVVAAPLLVEIYAGKFTEEAKTLTLALAYWCLPQLLFYGLYALVGEVLNANRIFGPFAWSPIVNNVISISGFGVFIALFGTYKAATGWTAGMIALMGGTATLGIVVQAGILFLFWRRAGLHVRPDFHWRGIGLRHIGRLAGWTFLMVVAGQIAGAVQVNIVGAASGTDAAGATLQNAWLLFMLPFSVIVLSLGTPYYTRLSEHVAEGRTDAVTADLSSLTRTVGIFMVGVLAAMIVAAVPLARLFTTDPSEAVAFAWVLVAYLVALLPLSFQFGLQRTFYALKDTRTPFVYTLVQAAIVIATALTASALLGAGVLSREWLAVAIALGQSVANIVQFALAITLLRRKIGPLGLSGAFRGILRFLLAAIPAAVAGWGVFALFGGVDGWAVSERLLGFAGAALIGGTTLVVYAAILAVFRTPELTMAGRALRRFLPGR
ncbi:murein biosynthesis integral membrane protein MurJ [Microbacterium oleivorans]|uniref:Putative membrane protein, putative virulence factor n=1 Tax=Microbacterium oleivorans TaxID=273677 RepID=A0A031FT08_9MICO|nr:murein biosynthesis integral membrane protein MurJ [Microbacterium oleivorans]EZP27698.1 putative membrane protein, putative virulence factor [Microbacterium oleivorans]